jgi:diguanylate cyclase (GGDEF)-like protein/PAS domain S-box-containing protein
MPDTEVLQTPIRVLHIEDNALYRELIRETLTGSDIPFDLAAVGEQLGLEHELSTREWDCVLSDMHIGTYTGIDVLEFVRDRHPHLPVVILTGTGTEELAVQAMKLGAADYILKTSQHIARLPLALQATVKAARDAALARRAQVDLQLAATVFHASGEGIIITDAARRIVLVNPFFERITGYAASEVIGRDPRLLRSDAHDAAYFAAMWEAIGKNGFWQGELNSRRKDGTTFASMMTISVVRNPAGELTHYVGLFSDLTARKELDERLRRLTWYDALTGLPNRTLLNDRLDQALGNARRYGRSVAVLVTDLARFRTINDTLGHEAGNAILIEIAHRLNTLGRPGDTMARIGADEFAVVLANLDKDADVIALANQLIETITVPIEVAGQRLSVSVNIGIGLYPKDGERPEDLMKAADIALERARGAGLDTFRFFTTEMDLDAERRLRLESDLHGAIERGELELHYQPQVNLVNGRICGCEALLRWQHPEFGPISPAEFIPLAEEVRLIQRLGSWVLETACRQKKAWRDAGLHTQLISVNISARQFHQAGFVESVANALAVSGLPASALELELTERAFIADNGAAAHTLARLKSLGVQLALDDFGTGYSSISHLSGFPFDKLKIDRSFVHGITENPVNAAIATATIAMGRGLDLVVLAEGVETESQMQFLRTKGCEAMQGWLFSKALPAGQFTDLLRAGTVLKVGAGETVPDTLLIVDDEAGILNSLKRLLRRDGYTILTAESPALAFDLLARNTVQVIVSDQRMPEMSGTEFLSRVKQLYPETIRIVLSGYTDLQSVTDAINRGAIYRFLTKPWDDEALRVQIREAFRVARGLNQG